MSSQSPTPYFTLNTSQRIPSIGFGTWKAAPGAAGLAVRQAFAAGYRHFDCAPLYSNEEEIGSVFSSISIPRSEYFVTTKLWSSDHQRVQQALDKSLKDLQLEYVDLYLMHWPITLPPTHPNVAEGEDYGKEDRKNHVPNSEWNFLDTWSAMEDLILSPAEGGKGKGKVKAIGVANFSVKNLSLLLKHARIIPAVNQTELHPLLPQEKLNAFCREHGIHQTAFGPLGGSGSTLHTSPVITSIASARGTSTGNVLLSWGVQRGWSVIPKSTNEKRIEENLKGNFVLTDQEMQDVGGLVGEGGRGGKRFNRPDWGTVVFGDDEGLDLQ